MTLDDRIQKLKALGFVDNGRGKLQKHYSLTPFVDFEQLEKLDDDMFQHILECMQDLNDDCKMYDGDITG